MKLLVFQHIACEHPGSLRRFLERDGITWDVVELDQNEPIPNLSDYDLLWVMGGPMDVWDVGEHPWLVKEKAAIRTWVRDLGKPFLGLCLGHQLLADALGGTCGPQKPSEIGVMDTELTPEGRNDALFAGLPVRQKCLQWHSVGVAQTPENAVILAKTPACPVQAMRLGRHAWSTQYHLEVEPDAVANWAAIPAYHNALTDNMGADGVRILTQDAAENMDGFLKRAELLYDNFMRSIKS